MITLVIQGQEVFDNRTQEFIQIKPQHISMEHSLISLSKWESKWKKPFITLSREPHTREETLDYLRCMTINRDVDPLVYNAIPNAMINAVNNYIEDSRTATKIYNLRKEDNKPKKLNKDITSEELYAQMVKLGIPFDPCEKWHLNRLIMLIRVCTIENGDKEKMSKKDLYAYHRALNNSRRSRGKRH